MITLPKSNTKMVSFVFLGVSIVLASSLLLYFYPIGIDWAETYSRLRLKDPYAVSSFVNPPFTVLFLPHILLPVRLGNAVNVILNIVITLIAIRHLGGKWAAIALVFTSPVMFDLFRTNNIEWLPLLGLIAGAQWGSLLLICKPQSLGGAFLIWAKRDWKILFVPVIAILLSFAIWGFWPLQIGFNPVNKAFNFSVLPIGIPYGVYLLYQAWRTDDEYLAAVSTPLLVPYIAPYSLASVLCVLASKYPKAAVWFYFGTWAFAIIEYRRLVTM